MSVDIIGIAVSVARSVASKAINVAADKMRLNAKSKLESYSEEYEAIKYLQSALQKDIEGVKKQIESCSQAQVTAALQMVKDALIIIKVTNHGTEVIDSTTALTEAPISFCIPEDAKSLLVEARNLAMKAFPDRVNIPVAMRLDALKIQIFCTIMLYQDKPEYCAEIFFEKVQLLTSDRQLKSLLKTRKILLLRSKSKSDDINSCRILCNEIRSAAFRLCFLWNGNSKCLDPLLNALNLKCLNRSPDKVLHYHSLLNVDGKGRVIVLVYGKRFFYCKFANCILVEDFNVDGGCHLRVYDITNWNLMQVLNLSTHTYIDKFVVDETNGSIYYGYRLYGTNDSNWYSLKYDESNKLFEKPQMFQICELRKALEMRISVKTKCFSTASAHLIYMDRNVNNLLTLIISTHYYVHFFLSYLLHAT